MIGRTHDLDTRDRGEPGVRHVNVPAHAIARHQGLIEVSGCVGTNGGLSWVVPDEDSTHELAAVHADVLLLRTAAGVDLAEVPVALPVALDTWVTERLIRRKGEWNVASVGESSPAIRRISEAGRGEPGGGQAFGIVPADEYRVQQRAHGHFGLSFAGDISSRIVGANVGRPHGNGQHSGA